MFLAPIHILLVTVIERNVIMQVSQLFNKSFLCAHVGHGDVLGASGRRSPRAQEEGYFLIVKTEQTHIK